MHFYINWFIIIGGVYTLLYCIYGGVLSGIGYGLVFFRNGSIGGTDIITMVVRKKYSYERNYFISIILAKWQKVNENVMKHAYK